MRVRAAPPHHYGWIVHKTQCSITPNARAIEVVDDLGFVKGMVLYDNWTENAVQAHMAVSSPFIWRYLLPTVFEYPFIEAKKSILMGVIPSHNAPSVRMVKHLGFHETYRVKDGWAVDDDLVFFEMRKEQCRWIQKEAA